MLVYISSSSRPDIQFTVHQCSMFIHNPSRGNSNAVKRICYYLIGTQSQGLTFDPNSFLKPGCYVDADFSVLWNHEDDQYSVCVKLSNRYAMTLVGRSLHWVIDLQTYIALSTLEF